MRLFFICLLVIIVFDLNYNFRLLYVAFILLVRDIHGGQRGRVRDDVGLGEDSLILENRWATTRLQLCQSAFQLLEIRLYVLSRRLREFSERQ